MPPTRTSGFPLDVELTHTSFTISGAALSPAETKFQQLTTADQPLEHERNFSAPKPVYSLNRTDEPTQIDTVDIDASEFLKRPEDLRRLIFELQNIKKQTRIQSKLVNFSDIVDLDDEGFEDHVQKELAPMLLESTYFNILMTALIFLNAGFIAAETNRDWSILNGSLFSGFEYFFLTAFSVEIALKWYVGFGKFWRSGWNVFDFLIIAAAILAPAITFVSTGRVLRILRILRAFRAARSVKSLEGLRMVAKTIVESIPDMINIILLLFLLMFIFGVVGVTLFEQYSPSYFPDLPMTIFSLFVLTSQDGWVDIFTQLDENGAFIPASIFFTLFITIGAFIVVNMIVAVVVAKLDRDYQELEASRKKRMRSLKGKLTDTASNLKPIVALDEKLRECLLHQVPIEIPDISKIPKSTIEDYLLIVKLLEDNVEEYCDIKSKLVQILVEEKKLNANQNANRAISNEIVDDFDELSEEENLELLQQEAGDPLSRLLSSKRR